WSPFFEARDPRDFDMMAAALIPQQKDTVDPFWVTAARQLFSNGAGVFWKQGVKDNRVLVDHLLKTELTALAEAMAGTVAQSIVDPENPKTALSVRAMLTANVSALELLPDTGKPFSIREWISDEARGGFLFLTSRGDQHASLRGLISTWLEIAVNAMLSLAQSDGRRIWVILDELPTLHQVPSLQPGLAESRQFGGCFVLGVQVASALRDLYGRNGAETISGLCGTRVVLAAPDRDTAQWSADSLGRSEIEEVAEGYSYGANTIRDGVSLTPRRELRALALPSEIMRLPNLEGYLKFPGPLPVASIRLKYVSRPASAERFVPRDGDGTGTVNEDGVGEEGPAANGDGSGAQAVPPDVLPEKPEGWFGQGELDLVAPAQADREAKTAAGPEAPAAVQERKGSGPANETAAESGDAPGPVRAERGDDAATPEGAPAKDKSAPAAQPEPAPAPPEAPARSDGLTRY
ncbi:MAG: type IV secretion system DNA-binding domain-containing protein, partial [Immundisolibacterales bacterium]|nr:type IV secretion system DNA-binding domain-containing protein [Immundisolibacterales bacterium]